MSEAQRLYQESRDLFVRGLHAEALATVERALALEPALENGDNFAGWICMNVPSRSRADLERAVAHFEAALDRDPGDGTPLVNLADALLALGRGDEAARRVSEHKSARALNWLGWYYTERDLPRAIELLERAVRTGGWWGPAHLNLARAYEMAGRDDDAYERYGSALMSKDCQDPARCHARRAAIEERRGRVHHALSSIRRARTREQRDPRGRDLGWAGEESRFIEILSGRREYFPHVVSEARWMDLEIRAQREGLGLDHEHGAPSAREVGALLRRAREADQSGDTLDAIESVLVHRELAPELSNRAFELDLRVPVLELLDAAWLRFHYFLYQDLSRREIPPDPIETALREGRADDAVALLRAKDTNALVDAIGQFERAGEHAAMIGKKADAITLLQVALDGYTVFASWSTSGGEGMARMLDVDRIKKRLADIRRDAV